MSIRRGKPESLCVIGIAIAIFLLACSSASLPQTCNQSTCPKFRCGSALAQSPIARL